MPEKSRRQSAAAKEENVDTIQALIREMREASADKVKAGEVL